MIRTAVVPVAGRGTRLLPATRAVPKALLPIVDRPLIDLVIEELTQAGIDRVVLVVGELRGALERHLAENEGGVDVVFADQPEPLGLGDAVLCGAEEARDEPFVVALGDALIDAGGRPAGLAARLIAAYERSGAAAAVAVHEVAPEAVRRYGIVDAERSVDGAMARGLVEKPDPADAPSRLAVAARYVLGPAAVDALRDQGAGYGGEIQLTDALARVPVVAVALADDERRLDAGDPEGYAEAFVTRALADPRFGADLRQRALGVG